MTKDNRWELEDLTGASRLLGQISPQKRFDVKGIGRFAFFREFLGVIPFLAFVGLFLLVPTFSVVANAFRSDRGGLTLSNFVVGLSGTYLISMKNSLELSVVSALVASVIGVVTSVAVVSSRARTVRSIVMAASGVFANTGGVPLAFSFIATLGNYGLVTQFLSSLGENPYDHGFSLYSVLGLAIVYQYFLIPLMVLIMTPPIDALKREWVDAANSLGASRIGFWRHVGGPLLFPPFLAGFLVLFADAFAAYATAEALTSGTIPIVSIQIGSLISGNVLVGYSHLGNALGAEMIGVVVISAVLYQIVQTKASKWLR